MRRELRLMSLTIIQSKMQGLASQHEAKPAYLSNKLRSVYLRNYVKLKLIRRRLSRCPSEMITLIPASRWLFENYHRLYLSLKAFQAGGAASRFKKLAVLESGPGKGFPRIYLIAREIIEATHYHLNEASVVELVNAYQKIRILDQQEIDLLPEVIRFCILDRVIEESERILPAIENKVRADDVVNRIAPQVIEKGPEAISELKKHVSLRDLKDFTFSSHLIYRLNGLCVCQGEIIEIFSELLGENGNRNIINEITENETLFESETEGVISALIESLKEISDIDHDRFVASVSGIDKILALDPACVYAKMNGPTRATYRKVVMRLAKRNKMNETDVAQEAVQCAKHSDEQPDFHASDHVGSYLLGSGKAFFRERLAGREAYLSVRKALRALGRVGYFFGILSISLGLVPLTLFLFGIDIFTPDTSVIAFALLMIVPASGIAVYIMNNIASRLVDPQVTLAMDFDRGIPEYCKSFVVMPVLVASPAATRQHIESLERHHLVNRDPNLVFALLVDFKDAQSQTLSEDKDIIDAAYAGIDALNQKYGNGRIVFQLFYRCRQWNDHQKCWMGWERKRGKLEDFNAMLLGEKDDLFEMPIVNKKIFSQIKYVITLDADTEMPQDTAAQLIGILEHPLNRPVLDEQGKSIKSGYAIVQSEIRNRLPAPSAGLFQAVLSGQAGFDPYATVVSDVYQDMFSEGIYVGKGIYDLRAFHQLMKNKIPENKVLSHDLLEGCLTRCAFAGGVKLVDKVPTSIDSFLKREHRWVRGDWQLLPYLIMPRGLKILSKWKIADNIRRSLLYPAQLFLIIANIILFPEAPWIWPIFIFFEWVGGMLFLFSGIIRRKLMRLHERLSPVLLLRILADYTFQTFYRFILLPVRSVMALDAAVRTLFRLFISRRNLLEWQTADLLDKNAKTGLNHYVRKMWASYVLAGVFIFYTLNTQHVSALIGGLLFFVLFMVSPCLAALSEKPIPRGLRRCRYKKIKFSIRQLSLRIWHYYADTMRKETHYLCPDHIQEHPGPKSADRTSPTNIGLQLLAASCARDMGFISLSQFVSICEKVLPVARRLPTWKGHLYNWYDTKTLEPIEPLYVSTVDSGNYLAHLLVLKQGLLDCINRPVFTRRLCEGLDDICQYQVEDTDYFNRKNFRYSTEKLKMNKTYSEEYTNAFKCSHAESFYTRVQKLASSPDTSEKVLKVCQDYLRDLNTLGNGQMELMIKTPAALAESKIEEAVQFVKKIERLVSLIDRVIYNADFRPLYDPRKRLFRIGYNVSLQKLDKGHYDLLASEARAASFFAVAKGDVPKRHWTALGRPMTLVKGMPALVSWSGSMFEYMMPNLIMRVPPGSVMDQSCRAAVACQQQYARKLKMPWGISESQYYIFDNNANYQYGPFGVGKLRLQPSLKPVKVIAPYATILALGTAPKDAIKNIRKLMRIGAGGKYGLYEALDYSSPDPTSMMKHSVVRSFMTHHLGMSLAAINNLVNSNVLQDRFHSEPMIKANEVLLEETLKSPLITIASVGYNIDLESRESAQEVIESRVFDSIEESFPTAHVLSNGRYQVMMTRKGDGFSACDHILINRWRPRRTDGGYGNYIYIKDTDSGRLWSTSYFPVMARPDQYKVIFSHDKVEYIRRDGDISTRTEIAISPTDPIEIRRIHLINHGSHTVNLSLTSYLEIVVDDYTADLMHPAYSKLFIKTEFMAERNMLVGLRRAKNPGEKPRCVMHMVASDQGFYHPVRYETGRHNFIGRRGSLMRPEALIGGMELTSRDGASTDPILSLQATVVIPPGRSVSLRYVTGYCKDVNHAVALADKQAARQSDDDLFKIAHTSSLLEVEYLRIRSAQLNAIQNLVGSIYYPSRVFKSEMPEMGPSHLGQSGLWRFGISGDWPILLLRIRDVKEKETLSDVLQAFEFLRFQKVRVNLIILNESEGGYDDALQQMIFEQTATLRIFDRSLNRAGIFVLRASRISIEEKTLIYKVARIIFTSETGIYFRNVLSRPIVQREQSAIPLPSNTDVTKRKSKNIVRHSEPVPEFFNGIGGFVRDGREYEIRLEDGINTPAPWINVIANSNFGFQISEIGAGYTWSENSRENKLTPWYNDPVLDPVSEALYVKDRQSGAILSPCALSPEVNETHRVRHGFGYSVFSRPDEEIDLQMTVFAAEEDPVKLVLLTIENKTDQEKKLSAAYYAQWVLGVFAEQTQPYIFTEYDHRTQMFYAVNTYMDKEKQKPAFLFSSHQVSQYTGDRKSFIGVEGSARYPVGLAYGRFKRKTGEGLDPCSVLVCDVDIAPNSSETVVFGLGQTPNKQSAELLANKYKDIENTIAELAQIHQVWTSLPGEFTVRTPDRALDILMNGWMLYQVIACRLRARAAFYQCGGAFGFRDQLQDVLATMSVDSRIAYEQILRCSSRQFLEGDVQHWWHEPEGFGVRTNISDDLLWLPYAVAEYIAYTGSMDILDEKTPFLVDNPLHPGEHERVSHAQQSEEIADIYSHCLLAIDHACAFGVRGLPLIKGGDWNDGMNRVGEHGKGESVWLGWFLYSVLKKFAPLCEQRDDAVLAERYRQTATQIQNAIEREAWDGAWYRRAFFDNGDPLGSALNDECRIDSISQSWAVISGAGEKARALQALSSAKNMLVDQSEGIIRLLTPPFDESVNHPGYIQGYLPGMRENGGQYTHAATWLVKAFCMQGDSDTAYRLLNILNPVRAASDFRSVNRYEREPYVLCADVYGVFPNTGKGGWSWYTGAAGWFYRVVLNDFLGILKEGDIMFFKPCVPLSFQRYQVEYRVGDSLYEITVEQKTDPKASRSLEVRLDCELQDNGQVRVFDDGGVHRIDVVRYLN